MPSAYTTTLKVDNYDELRDKLPGSGIFDMMDCSVEIWCPELAEAAEVERMTKLIESMVNVVDVRVGSTAQDMTNVHYTVKVTEVQNPMKRFTRER